MQSRWLLVFTLILESTRHSVEYGVPRIKGDMPRFPWLLVHFAHLQKSNKQFHCSSLRLLLRLEDRSCPSSVGAGP